MKPSNAGAPRDPVVTAGRGTPETGRRSVHEQKGNPKGIRRDISSEVRSPNDHNRTLASQHRRKGS